MAADFNAPEKTQTYETLLASIRELTAALSTLMDSRNADPSNKATYAKRWNDTLKTIQEWSGTAWANKAQNIVLTASPASDHTAIGVIVPMVLGETFTLFQTGCVENDSKLWLAKADAAATLPARYMVLAAGIANATVDCLLLGYARDDSWSWTVGGEIYASASVAGGLTQTPPANPTEFVQSLGQAVAATRVFFNPCPLVTEVVAET